MRKETDYVKGEDLLEMLTTEQMAIKARNFMESVVDEEFINKAVYEETKGYDLTDENDFEHVRWGFALGAAYATKVFYKFIFTGGEE